MDVVDILLNASDAQISDAIIDSFKEIERNFYLKSWKESELDAGHFVEAVRRFIEFKLTGTYTPIGSNLSNFNEQALTKYLNSTGDEAYRIHIPRALWLIYGIRNKRGIGHLSRIKANQVDATLILQTCKWVLAELVRLNSTYAIHETEALIDEVIERNVEGVWNAGEIKRILIPNLKLKEQILILLYNFKSLKDKDLDNIIENGNFAYLRKTLKDLHKDRMIEYQKDSTCILSPLGATIAETILLSI